MEEKKNTSKFLRYARIALILHAFVLVLFILHIGMTLFIPLFFAFLTAILLYPVTQFFERMHLGKGISAILSVVLFIIFIGAIVFFFNLELAHFLKDLPKVQSKFQESIQGLQNWISNKYNIDDAKQMSYFGKSVNGILSSIMSSAGSTVIGLVEFLVLFAFFLIFTFFILNHRRLLREFLLAFFDKQQQVKVHDIVDTIRNVINSYVLGLLTEIAVLFALIFTTLMIMGIKYALLMAVIAGILNIIPYIGIYTAAAFSMLIALANGTGGQAIEIAIVFIVVHFLDANIIMPHIVGGRVKINPFITIVAVIMGRLVWGIPGMFLFIPLMAMVRIISERVDEMRPWAILIGEDKDY